MSNTGMSETDQLISDWLDAKAKKAELEARERDLRERVIAAHFNEPNELAEGTHTHKLAHGWALKVESKRNRKLTIEPSEVPRLIETLEKGWGATDVIRTKYELGIKAYRELPNDARAVVNRTIETTHATPTLELVEPKKK